MSVFTSEVTADQGVPQTLGNAWPIEVTDGTNVLGTSAHPVKIDPTGTTTQPVNVTNTVTTTPPTSSTATIARVATSTTDAVALAANAGRKMAIIATETGNTYVAYGAVATTTAYTVLLPANSVYEVELWTGAIHVIRSSGTGNIQVTELT